jgi:hypothetical protein
MQIQLTWTDPNTGQQQQPFLETPVALGREFNSMPGTLNGNRVSRVTLPDSQVAGYHATIDWVGGKLMVINQDQNIGTLVNGMRLSNTRLIDGDRLQIGIYEILVNFNPSSGNIGGSSGTQECDRMVGFLFKRRCGRTSNVGCTYCNGGQNNDPYFTERSYYRGYGTYSGSSWGHIHYSERHNNQSTSSSDSSDVDFTEADSSAFGGEADTDFEQDMGAS